MTKELTQYQCDRLSRFGFHRVAPSLYLQIRPHGSRSWLFRYKRHGRQHWFGLGSTRIVPLKAAKARARALIVGIEAGQYPEKQAPVPSFAKAVKDYIATHEGSWRNAKHRQQWRNTLETYAKPLARLPVNEIEPSHIAKALRPIWTEKPETARRVRGRIKKILNAAKAAGFRSGDNPADLAVLRHLLAVSRRPVKHHKAAPADAIPLLIAELNANDSTSARALLWTILTAARTSETLGATVDEIGGDVWTIPAARMKAARAHRVPLASPLLERLERWQVRRGLLFPGRNGELSNMAMMQLLRGLYPKEKWTVHGFRSTFRDWNAEKGFSREVCESALAHKVAQNTAEAAYLRSDLFEHEHSAARGEMAVRKLIVFKHASALGNAPAHKLFDLVHVGRNVDGEMYKPGDRRLDNLPPARRFDDYLVQIDRRLPDGVEIIERL